jgi:hypothetical protein
VNTVPAGLFLVTAEVPTGLVVDQVKLMLQVLLPAAMVQVVADGVRVPDIGPATQAATLVDPAGEVPLGQAVSEELPAGQYLLIPQMIRSLVPPGQ